ncbi:MAG: hypothetical protein M3Q56_05270 [Bacteroidota bacterium]|nr:hypothetical protein [Bacteroidota bacterium]
MSYLLTGTIIISILHALIPSHWLPLIVISKTQKWTVRETLRITFYLGASHILGTILLGLLLIVTGTLLNKHLETFFVYFSPVILIILGLYFIYRHHTHHHFHLDDQVIHPSNNKRQLILALSFYMLISPCFEVEAYFFAASPYGLTFFFWLAGIYAVFSLAGMMIWVYLALKGLDRFNWHRLEHNAGLITGITIVLSGILGFFLH